MDWEGKVSSLLRETETNLSKVKRKVGSTGVRGCNDWKYKKFSNSFPMKKYSSWSDVNQRPPQYQSPVMTSSMHGSHLNMTDTSPAFTHSLQEKLDQQNKLIDQLMQMVHKLESERNNYSEQIRDIRGEIQHLGGKIPGKNKAAEPYIDHRIEQVKRDLLSEIHLSNQHNMYRAKSDGYQATESHLNNLSRDMQDLKHTVRDDMEIIKRDVDVMKTRVMKMEMDVSSLLTNNRNLEQRQDRLDRAVQNISSYPHSSKTPSLNTSTGYSWQTPSSSEKLQLTELRSTLSTLKHKVDTVEASIQSRDQAQTSLQPQRYSSMNGYMPFGEYKYSTETDYKPYTANGTMELEELNLSDDDTSLDTFSAGHPTVRQATEVKTTQKITADTLDSDDDLDLDDLDLSDDDSLDSEPLNSTRF